MLAIRLWRVYSNARKSGYADTNDEPVYTAMFYSHDAHDLCGRVVADSERDIRVLSILLPGQFH